MCRSFDCSLRTEAEVGDQGLLSLLQSLGTMTEALSRKTGDTLGSGNKALVTCPRDISALTWQGFEPDVEPEIALALPRDPGDHAVVFTCCGGDVAKIWLAWRM